MILISSDAHCGEHTLRKTVVYLDTKNTKPWHSGFLRSQSCVFVTLNCAFLSGKMRKSTLAKKKTDLCLYNTYQRRKHRTVLMKCLLVCKLHNIISNTFKITHSTKTLITSNTFWSLQTLFAHIKINLSRSISQQTAVAKTWT